MRESNPRTKLCRLLPNHSANAPELKSKMGSFSGLPIELGAGKEVRTPDLYLGKVSLYQLSYSRITGRQFNKQSKRKHYSLQRLGWLGFLEFNQSCQPIVARPFSCNRTWTKVLKTKLPKSAKYQFWRSPTTQIRCH